MSHREDGEIEGLAKESLRAALAESGRGNFVKQYLLVLWPASKVLMLGLARRLGGEIRLPEEPLSLLSSSLAEGADNFYQRKGLYNPATWDMNVFLHFYQGVFLRAGAVLGCKVRSDGSCWEAEQEPYLDWRLAHPGDVDVRWEGKREALLGDGAAAARLCRLVLSTCNYSCTWAVQRLLHLLGDDGHGHEGG